jgi:hypothetical protein
MRRRYPAGQRAARLASIRICSEERGRADLPLMLRARECLLADLDVLARPVARQRQEAVSAQR